jgi:excisionase family DNA binding protein
MIAGPRTRSVSPGMARTPGEPALSGPLLTIRELAAYLNLNIKTVERMARAGRLPSLRVCGRVRFRPGDIASWLAEREDRTCRDC